MTCIIFKQHKQSICSVEHGVTDIQTDSRQYHANSRYV